MFKFTYCIYTSGVARILVGGTLPGVRIWEGEVHDTGEFSNISLNNLTSHALIFRCLVENQLRQMMGNFETLMKMQ